MSERQREEISALLDDNLESAAIDPLLKGLATDDSLRDLVNRYRLIGDAMRGEPVRPNTLDIAARVREQLREEPTILAPKPRSARPTTWTRPLIGTALAASIALVAVLVAPRYVGMGSHETAPLAASEVPDRNQVTNVASNTKWKKLAPQVESKLNGYLVDHNEFSPHGGVTGILPYASFVSHDGR